MTEPEKKPVDLRLCITCRHVRDRGELVLCDWHKKLVNLWKDKCDQWLRAR